VYKKSLCRPCFPTMLFLDRVFASYLLIVPMQDRFLVMMLEGVERKTCPSSDFLISGEVNRRCPSPSPHPFERLLITRTERTFSRKNRFFFPPMLVQTFSRHPALDPFSHTPILTLRFQQTRLENLPLFPNKVSHVLVDPRPPFFLPGAELAACSLSFSDPEHPF